MSEASRPILIIKAGATFDALRERYGDFEDWIARGLGLPRARTSVCAVFAGQALPAAETLCAAVITGSHAMVSDREPWSQATAEWLRDAVDGGLPVLGICYGHQLLAHAFAGRVDYHPRGREIGTVQVRSNREGRRDVLLGGLAERFAAHTTHAQSVLELPATAVLLAGNDYEPHHAFRIGARAWGVQFHPEFDAAVMRAYVEHQAPLLRAGDTDLSGIAATIAETPEASRVLRRFAELVTA